MGLELRFLPYTSGDSDGVEVYRADTLTGEKKKLASLDPGVHTFNDRSVEANRIYWYWILSKAAVGDKWSQPLNAATFIDKGPGPQTLLRGDWGFGYMGFIPVENAFTYDAVKLSGNIVGVPQTSSPLTGFHKCLVNGQILLIGDQPYSFGITAADLGNALLPVNGDVTAASTIAIGADQFRIRCPFSTTAFTTAPSGLVGPDATIARSEVGMLAALITGIDTGHVYGNTTLADMGYNGITDPYFSNTYFDSSKVLGFTLAPAAAVATVLDMSAQRPFWPVFELVLHD